MQAKIARASRFSAWFNGWAIRRGFPLLSFVAPRVSRRVLRLGAWVIINTVMLFHWRPKRAIDRNLARVLALPTSDPKVKKTRKRMMHNLAFYWADLFRFAQLPPEAAQDKLAGLYGLEHLEAAQAADQGVLLLTAHLGNWELGGLFVRPTGVEVSVVYVPDEFEDAEAFRSKWRQLLGVEEIPIRPGEAFGSLPVIRALRQGRFVALQGDRDFDETGTACDFFGASVPMPRGPFLLARLSGAIVLPTFIVYTDDDRFEIHIDKPITVAGSVRHDGGLEAGAGLEIDDAMREWVVVLEQAVRRWPDQWYTFFDYWPAEALAGAAKAPTAGMEVT